MVISVFVVAKVVPVELAVGIVPPEPAEARIFRQAPNLRGLERLLVASAHWAIDYHVVGAAHRKTQVLWHTFEHGALSALTAKPAFAPGKPRSKKWLRRAAMIGAAGGSRK